MSATRQCSRKTTSCIREPTLYRVYRRIFGTHDDSHKRPLDQLASCQFQREFPADLNGPVVDPEKSAGLSFGGLRDPAGYQRIELVQRFRSTERYALAEELIRTTFVRHHHLGALA